MTLDTLLLRYKAAKSDRERDAAIPLPENVTEKRNIAYGSHGKENLLDVYYPAGTTASLPTIVSIHGGGYVYGDKEVYRRYCMDLARRGFAVVNFTYRLAPKWKFPTPLADTNQVMLWIRANAKQYHLDPERIFLVGDSAGAQLASQYAAMQVNPEYAAHFQLNMARIRIRAVALNCGLYDPTDYAQKKKRKGIYLDYLGKDIPVDDPRLKVLDAMDSRYPPAFLTTGTHDFLRGNAEPMWQYLTQRGIQAQWRCYGAENDASVVHVFHCNIIHPEAVRCNDDTAAFFRKYL